MLDTLIKNGWIVDGSGAPRFRGNVGIAGGEIAWVGDAAQPAHEVVDAAELIVAPGFIDSHVHSEVAVLTKRGQEASNRQGITTHIVGQCGLGFAPTDERSCEFIKEYLAGPYGKRIPLHSASIREFLDSYDGRTTVNVATLAPHGCLRMQVVGTANRELRRDEMREACRLTAQAMVDGAIGLSTGLDYVPSSYASTDELITLAHVAGEHGGVYVSHVRYSLGIGAAVEEALEIGRKASIPVHISHLYWNDGEDPGAVTPLGRVDAARREGLDVTFDCYPYTYSSTFLGALLPGWVFEDGDWPTIRRRLLDQGIREALKVVVDYRQFEWSEARLAGSLRSCYRPALGSDLLTAAAAANMHPIDYVCDLLVAHKMAVTLVWSPKKSEGALSCLEQYLRHPAHMLGSDGLYAPGVAHPRGYGAFARYVGRYVRGGLISLEEAVRHVTSAPARRFGLYSRGLIASGQVADVVIFDSETLLDCACDIASSKKTARGVKDLFLGGIAVLRDGVRTGVTPARGLRRESLSSLRTKTLPSAVRLRGGQHP